MALTTSQRNRRKKENRVKFIASISTVIFLFVGGLFALLGFGISWGWDVLWERFSGWASSGSGLLWLFVIIFLVIGIGVGLFWMNFAKKEDGNDA